MPLVDPNPEQLARLAELGQSRPINLYRALANHPPALRGWVELAWALRLEASTPRGVRELIILRAAQVHRSAYEWTHHRLMAAEAGVAEVKVTELDAWRGSAAFDARERAALGLVDAIVDGSVPDEIDAELDRHFSAAEKVELVMTAALYTMVPRVLDALRVPLE